MPARSLPMEVTYSVYAFAMPFELVIILPFTSSPFRVGLDFPKPMLQPGLPDTMPV